jgi:hypothetical protein
MAMSPLFLDDINGYVGVTYPLIIDIINEEG